MKIIRSHTRQQRQAGQILFQALLYSGVLGITCFALLELSQNRVRSSYNRWDYNEAFYHAENALNWGVQRVADSATPAGDYKATDSTLGLSYYATLTNSGDSSFQEAWLSVAAHPSGAPDMYLVTTSAKVGDKVRTLQAAVQKNPPSQVFDYEYFLNNWGWWWGSSITGNGDNRSNWDFDFQGNPTVNGGVIANGQIVCNGTPIDPLSGSVPIVGLAGGNPVAYLHDGAPRLPMPNLKDFTYYEALALTELGTLSVGGTLVVAAVHVNPLKPGLYLSGTTNDPITINGPVVIPGDVVLKGVITGIGTLYVGGSLYIAGNVTYKNGPDFSSPPELMTPSARDAWVQNNINGGKDLVAFAVRESIFGGAVNTSEWKTRCYDPASYGLKNVGDESDLGADGIRGTPDDGINYLDTNNNGSPDSAWYDADGDGTVDHDYNWGSDIMMTAARALNIQDYPTTLFTPNDYDAIASNNFNTLHGIFYCNHAVGIRSTKSGFVGNGSIICQDEAIVFTGNLRFNYDSRIHSRYSNDPNRYIDLGLPVANKVSIRSLVEAKPVAGFCSTVYTGSPYGHMAH